ncbi:phytanoyl-CoA dioxygenase family protein [Mycolicibacterium mengxianglii]|uniref:phytanoyl-CoA dioxygenase family protein n=1 Tax=Mycolicibacterium mengxianglii TaxID=2736649 RepID=UPI0018D05DD1|nr:phytanoyl-CoA dioxygenase family protein [Mycolicibacterium mengxianglii]
MQPEITDAGPSISARPNDDDVAFYQEHGWWISPKVLSEEFLDAAADAAERFYRGRDRTLPFEDGYSNWTEDDGFDVVRNNEFVSLQSDDLRAVVCQPVLGAMAARLAGTDGIRLLDDQLVYKPPTAPGSTTSVVGWHADHAYWGTCSSDRLLTAWVPFHDVDEENGTLAVLDGSHRWPGTRHARFFNNVDLDALEERFAAEGHTVTRVPLRLRKGQVSFHHGWTLHASFPNTSAGVRLALAVHLQDADNRYVAARTPDGRPIQIFDELLCRTQPNGEPDFTDPDVFPTIWAKS